MKKLNLIGERYGKLKIIKWIGHRNNKILWLCKCDCGKFHEVTTVSLRSKNTRSCGCYRKELRDKSKPCLKHGMYGTKEYRAWQGMKRRCYQKSQPNYKNYGGRGIKVCREWLHNFIAFFNYIGYAPSEQHTIDRKDSNGHYEPGNIKWSTKSEQRLNQRKRRLRNATNKI